MWVQVTCLWPVLFKFKDGQNHMQNVGRTGGMVRTEVLKLEQASRISCAKWKTGLPAGK